MSWNNQEVNHQGSKMIFKAILIFVFCSKGFASALKITTDNFGKLSTSSDCSNTIAIGKFSAESGITLSPDSRMTDVVSFEISDNISTKIKKKKKQESKQFVFKPCEKEKKQTKHSDKFTQRLHQQCTNDAPQKYNWHVLIYRTDESMFMCQGVLIDKNWVVTVAHCLVQYDETYMEKDVLRIRIKDSSKHLKVTKVVVKKDFKYSTFTNDIALLKIEDASNKKNIKTMCLPHDPTTVNLPLRSAWWEGDAYDDGLAGEFFDGQIQKLSKDQCQRRIKHSAVSYSLDGNNICSGNAEYCDGDMWLRMTEGSPLFYRGKSNSVLIGLKSWGTGSFTCEKNSQTEVFIEVSKYLQWILKEIKS